MSVRRHLAVVATALGTVAAGLSAGATAGTASASTSAQAPAAQTVAVFVSRDHTVQMPATVRPGVTKFAISSRRAAGFQLAKADAGYTKREAARDINRAFNKNDMRALRRFERNMTLVGGMPTSRTKSATMSVRLRQGRYWALDSMPRVLDPKKIRTFEVTGDPVSGRLGGKILRATGEAKFGPLNQRLPRSGRILFQNRSAVPHFVSISKLAQGKTMQDFRAWMEQLKQGNETPPPVDFRISVDSGVVSGGEAMSFRYRLPKGRYVLTCWWPMSDMGGMPHAIMGMYRGLRIG